MRFQRAAQLAAGISRTAMSRMFACAAGEGAWARFMAVTEIVARVASAQPEVGGSGRASGASARLGVATSRTSSQ